MPEASTFKKARIVDANDPSKSVECHFNPATFQVTQTVAWKEHTTIGRDAPELSFAGGQGGDLNVELLFDTTATGADVRQAYRLLLDLAKIDQTRKNTKTGKGEPRLCRFEWGNFLSFDAVITNITQTFTLFNSDGTPLRAKVGVRFKQVDQPVRGQNPTSRARRGSHAWCTKARRWIGSPSRNTATRLAGTTLPRPMTWQTRCTWSRARS